MLNGTRSPPAPYGFATETDLCGVYSKCQCCSGVDGEWQEITVQCLRSLPEGTMHEERTLFIWQITNCECQECNGSYYDVLFGLEMCIGMGIALGYLWEWERE